MNIEELKNNIGKREIEFRAWIHPNDNKSKRCMQYGTEKNAGFYYQTVCVETVVMQYTGLKDKDGKKIFEGDIVTWKDGSNDPRIAIVEFSPELSFFAVNVKSYDGSSGHKFGFSDFIYTDTEKYIEIIGNIFENPELLPKNI